MQELFKVTANHVPGNIMLICLSSKATPRYLKNILQALAMPSGTRLNFRYQHGLVQTIVRDSINGKSNLIGEHCLLAYIDINETDVPLKLIPCRFATLEAVKEAGTTIIFTFELGGFAYAENLSAFNEQIMHGVGGAIPKWNSGKLDGHFCFRTTSELTQVAEFNDLAHWEKTTKQLAETSAFSATFFYTIDGVYRIDKGRRNQRLPRSVAPKNQVYFLQPGKEYEIGIYHYLPVEEPASTLSLSQESNPYPNAKLRIASSNDVIQFVSSTELAIDSPYDRKGVRFKTSKPSATENSLLSVSKEIGDTPAALDLDLQIAVKSAWFNLAILGIIIGILLAFPQILAVATRPAPAGSTPSLDIGWIIVIIVIANIGAGLTATFGIRKPV